MEHGETAAAARLWLSCERLPPRFLPDWRTELINPGAICSVPPRPGQQGRGSWPLTPKRILATAYRVGQARQQTAKLSGQTKRHR